VDTTSIRTDSPEVTPNARAERALELYRLRGQDIEPIAPDLYLLPSQDGKRSYRVDYRNETCSCPDHNFHPEMACKHILAAGVLYAKRRARRALCDGCFERFPVRELVELTEDNHDGLTYFDGDHLCRMCADGAGVDY
jgi:hypothetical protein